MGIFLLKIGLLLIAAYTIKKIKKNTEKTNYTFF